MFEKVKRAFGECQVKASRLAAAAAGLLGTSAAMATGSDPTTDIVTTLTAYAGDVGLLAAAVLLIYYGKKLVSYLRV